MAKDYPIAVATEQKLDGTPLYAAYLLDLPGCMAQGGTDREALDRLTAMKPAYFGKLLELGAPIPQPTRFPRIVPGSLGFYNPVTGSFSPVVGSALEGSSRADDVKLEAVG